jgi:cytochrome c peroxidase
MNRRVALHLIVRMTVLFLLSLFIGIQKTNGQTGGSAAADLSHILENKDLQRLGEKLFFDESLSVPSGQSCATCHAPEAGWSGPDDKINRAGAVYPGAIHDNFGNRKPPSAAYATLSPLFHLEKEGDDILFVGGNFSDGRATGWKLGNPAAGQAQGPFLNPVEQNMPDEKAVVEGVVRSDYRRLFRKISKEIWGIEKIRKDDNVDMAFGIIGLAIAAFEHSEKVNQFTSKYDYYLKGKVDLTPREKRGLELFEDKGKCAECHPSKPGPNGEPPLFTDFTYDNLGIPKNPLNPWYNMPRDHNPDGASWIDPGLADFVKDVPQYAMFVSRTYGKHKVPTLRNVDKRPSERFVKSYGHNGYFKSLQDIVHFYNTRDVLPRCEAVKEPKPGVNCWPSPEVPENVNEEELGDLELSPEEEAAIVEFLKTLSDGYELP